MVSRFGALRFGKVVEMLLRIRKAGSLSSSLCEWNPGNGKWYPIRRANMTIQGPLREQSNLFNALLAGLIVTIKGTYSRKMRKLKLEL